MKKYLNRKKMFVGVTRWIPLGFAVTAIFGVVYIETQFQMRSAANDPQVAIVRDIDHALGAGATYESFNDPNPIDLGESDAPYVLIYDLNHKPLAGSAVLHGEIPMVPRGVLEFAKLHGEHRLTWQPERGVRQAIVVLYHAGLSPAFVVVGRSLHETESRDFQLLCLTEITWSFAMLGSLILAVLTA